MSKYFEMDSLSYAYTDMLLLFLHWVIILRKSVSKNVIYLVRSYNVDNGIRQRNNNETEEDITPILYLDLGSGLFE